MDPIYVFKPGEGWVPMGSVFTMLCGTIVTLEFRDPNAGERYLCLNRSSVKAKGNIEEYFTKEVQNSRYFGTRERTSYGNNSLNYHYATVIKQ